MTLTLDPDSNFEVAVRDESAARLKVQGAECRVQGAECRVQMPCRSAFLTPEECGTPIFNTDFN